MKQLSSKQVETIIACMRQVADILEVSNTEEGVIVPQTENTAKPTSKKGTEKVVDKVLEEIAEVSKYEAMSFNELKAYAKKIGCGATGTKAQILANVLEAENGKEDKEVEIIEDEEPSDIEVQEEAGEEKTLAETVAEQLADSSDKEIKDILAEIGIKAPLAKRQALLDKVVKAIEEGKLDFGGEDEEAENEEEEEEELPGSEERKSAMEDLYADLTEKYENKELTDKEIATFLNTYYDGKAPKDNKEGKFNEYCRIQISLIDDEGDQHDLQDAYYVGDVIYCCGSETKNADDVTAICEICGQEYNTED
jgi:hypothetical protein